MKSHTWPVLTNRSCMALFFCPFSGVVYAFESTDGVDFGRYFLMYIADRSGQKKQVLGSKKVRLPKRLLHMIFGDFCEVLVLTPGTSVRNIEIHEMREDANNG